MTVLLILGTVISPFILLLAAFVWERLKQIFGWLALISLFYVQITIALTVHRSIRDHTVFMTDVHAILLNPLFLITASYVGIYLTYRWLLLPLMLKEI